MAILGKRSTPGQALLASVVILPGPTLSVRSIGPRLDICQAFLPSFPSVQIDDLKKKMEDKGEQGGQPVDMSMGGGMAMVPVGMAMPGMGMGPGMGPGMGAPGGPMGGNPWQGQQQQW